jgi:hypothetical protein
VTYRVVVWSTGNQGRGFLREVLENPIFELAGVFVYTAEKDGIDAGQLVGKPNTGITCTRDPEKILALDADVVLHSPKGHHLSEEIDADVLRLLESGKSVISTRGYYWPWYYSQDYADRLTEACVKGGAALMGWGPNPGWMTDSFTTCVAQMQLRLDELTATEHYNCDRLHTDMLEKMGFGLAREEFEKTPINTSYDELYIPNLLSLADKLGKRVEAVERTHQIVYAERAIEGLAVPVPKGGMQGTRRVWSAIVDGRPLINAEYLWFVGEVPGWPTGCGWQVVTRGRPNIKSNLTFTDYADDYDNDAMFTDAMAAMMTRAIPEVVEAEPGIFKAPVFASKLLA